MLTISSLTTQPRLILDVNSREDSPQREDFYQTLLDGAVAASINPIFDNEVAEFKPETEIDYYIFFSAFQNSTWLEQLKPNTESDFKFYLEESLSSLVAQAKKTITNPKTLLQDSGIPSPRSYFHYHKRRIDVLDEMPYVVLDNVNHLTDVTPSKEGVPIFYNSFSLPFTNNLDKWNGDTLGFSNKTFLYNSFLLIDLYTSNNPLTQKKIMSIPVYVNGRYMGYETSDKGVKQIRPSFYLDNATEGYSLVWLKNYSINTLYARFSFWDALNGKQITLLPSDVLAQDKKWVQNPNTFKQENLYLQINFNYNQKTYSLSEYNNKTGAYDIKTTSLDLYELVYDEYFSKLSHTPNLRPVKSTAEVVDLGADINLEMSQRALLKNVSVNFSADLVSLTKINQQYNQKHKGLLGWALHSIFQQQKVKLTDVTIAYFKRKFDDNGLYNEDLGNISITNNTNLSLLVKKIEVSNVKVVNKNNFFMGDPIFVNQFSASPVQQQPSYYQCDTMFTFQGSTFFQKTSPVKVGFDAVDTQFNNKQADMYSAYYFDESNNKVVAKPQEDVNLLTQQLDNGIKNKLYLDLLTKGGGIFSFLSGRKKITTKLKGLSMGDKDMNLMLRQDILEKDGVIQAYNDLFPATLEKLTHKTEDYRPYGITIKSTLSPQYEEINPGDAVNFNVDVIMGKEFFKLFISANDELTFNFDVNLEFVGSDGKSYDKIIPCSLKFN